MNTIIHIFWEEHQITNPQNILCAPLLLLHLPFVLVLFPWYTTHIVKLEVGPHVSEVREPIGHGKESGNGSNIPGILTVEALRLQRLEMLLCDGVAAAHRHRKVQHGELSGGQLCILVVDNDLGGSRRRNLYDLYI